MEIGQWQLELAGVMQCNINPANRGFSVATEESKERIKRRGWVRTQQSVPQSRLAHVAYRQILPLIPGITETGFPVPRLEIIAEFSHLTFEPNVKESIPVSELFTSRPRVVNATKPNPSSYRKTASVRKEICNSRIRDGEGIKRVLDWYADADLTKGYVGAWLLEWIRRKRHSRQGRSEIRADIFEISKYRQVSVTQIAREGTVECLAVSRRKCWRYSRKVIQEVIATALVISAGLWTELSGMRADDTGGAWICIGINGKRAFIKWISCRVWS